MTGSARSVMRDLYGRVHDYATANRGGALSRGGWRRGLDSTASMSASRGVGDLGVGERAVGGLEADGEGQAAPAVGDRRAPVHVEQADRPHQLVGRRPASRSTSMADTSSGTSNARSMSLDGNRLTWR